ncbi:ATP-dependent RNA helicase DDX56-like protein [Euroglyphus maynei]|uniref:RNA helicase n=1 Tax=Euroglyphus maynei TaxID=6958 RepID=A0A1Y3BGW9_EURMA|nr:ATP-dependent RNA helicase DDX56-like protein [Euroglyphus maynei]
MDISQGSIDDKRDFLVTERPDILIATPKKIVEYLQAKILNDIMKQLDFLVIDESDLMFSFGYHEDLLKVFKHIPSTGVQRFLMSATLNTDVKELKKLILNNPVILKLEEPDLPESDNLQQYHIEVFDDEEKFVLINALLKLGLIIGKTIIFVNNVDRCYRLRLFLEQFGIRTCVLNSELPIASRCHIVEQFNNDHYDIIIASDEKCIMDPNQRDEMMMKKRKKMAKKTAESSVARGIDFKFVSNIINFDFPTTIDSYIHRVGRTARGPDMDSNNGTVLSFVGPDEQQYFRRVSRKFQKQQSSETNLRPYQFRMDELESFRYRARDALRAVTTIAIREARLREIRRELLQSKRLQSFFHNHPKDHKILRFDRPLDVIKSAHGNRSHLKDLPDYIIPKTLQTVVKSKRENRRIEQQAMLNYEPSKRKKRKSNNNMISRKMKSKNNDPLKTFRMNAIQRYKMKKRNKSRNK